MVIIHVVAISSSAVTTDHSLIIDNSFFLTSYASINEVFPEMKKWSDFGKILCHVGCVLSNHRFYNQLVTKLMFCFWNQLRFNDRE